MVHVPNHHSSVWLCVGNVPRPEILDILRAGMIAPGQPHIDQTRLPSLLLVQYFVSWHLLASLLQTAQHPSITMLACPNLIDQMLNLWIGEYPISCTALLPEVEEREIFLCWPYQILLNRRSALQGVIAGQQQALLPTSEVTEIESTLVALFYPNFFEEWRTT